MKNIGEGPLNLETLEDPTLPKEEAIEVESDFSSYLLEILKNTSYAVAMTKIDSVVNQLIQRNPDLNFEEAKKKAIEIISAFFNKDPERRTNLPTTEQVFGRKKTESRNDGIKTDEERIDEPDDLGLLDNAILNTMPDEILDEKQAKKGDLNWSRVKKKSDKGNPASNKELRYG